MRRIIRLHHRLGLLVPDMLIMSHCSRKYSVHAVARSHLAIRCVPSPCREWRRDILRVRYLLIGVTPEVCTNVRIVCGGITHMGFSLVETHIHLHVQDWDVGGRREVNGFGRSRRENTRLAAQLWLFWWFRGLIGRLHG